MFNNGTYQARVKSGELLERIVKERHPAAPKANVPYCTKSQMVMYVDREGNEVATVHRYLQTNLTVGAISLDNLTASRPPGVRPIPLRGNPG